MMRSYDDRTRGGSLPSCARRRASTGTDGYGRCRENPCTGSRNERTCPCRTEGRAVPTGTNESPCEGERLLALIRQLDFALVETNLYLDTHPYSQKALQYFESLLKERNQAVLRYESNYGPLTAAGNGARNEWLWSTGAWPWQIDKESKR